MGYLTVKQFSEKWGISERRIINLCREDRINGAVKTGMVWMIPEDTVKPADKRAKIAEYINKQKKIIIVNIDNEISYYLIPMLKIEGYVVEGICSINSKYESKEILIRKVDYKNKEDIFKLANQSEKYYDGLIFIDLNGITDNKELLIELFGKKMDCSSSIVLINDDVSSKQKLEISMCKNFKENIGLRINAINLQAPKENTLIVSYDEICEDIMSLLKSFKNTTGNSINSDGGYLLFDKDGRTEDLNIGKFYQAINRYFNKLDKSSYMWCASTMLEDEWTEEPLEMNFRILNLEAANRGANIDRIFIFSKSKIPEFKNNKTLKIYMQSNINTMFVDYDEVMEKEPELIEIVGDGWDGINMETLIADLPESAEKRGYISINKREVEKAYKCFKKLKTYAKDLKSILK